MKGPAGCTPNPGISPLDDREIVHGEMVSLGFPIPNGVEVGVVKGVPKSLYARGLQYFLETTDEVQALKQLTLKPNLLVFNSDCDTYPRRFGLCSHIGFLAYMPTLGCIESILGGPNGQLDPPSDTCVEFIHKDRVI